MKEKLFLGAVFVIGVATVGTIFGNAKAIGEQAAHAVISKIITRQEAKKAQKN